MLCDIGQPRLDLLLLFGLSERANGMYSPFETMLVGMGERRESVSSAFATAPIFSSENHESSSRSGNRTMSRLFS
jgi:hypothetical protein